MSTDADKKIINNVITGLVGKDEPFTAYAIFKEAKAQGLSGGYGDHKDTIHENAKHFVTAGVYKTSKVDSPTGSTILYHPPNYDKNNYFKQSGDGNITI